MHLTYIAGPLTTGCFESGHFDASVYEENVRLAETMALECNRLGFATVCVHAESRHYFGAHPEAHWVASGLEKLRRCDSVTLTDGYASLRSKGTRDEVRLAIELGKPVFLASHWLSKASPEIPSDALSWIAHYEARSK